MNDIRHALRHLARNPGFSLAVILTLALGIGATTAIFSVFHAVLLKPLPYAEPAELVTVWETKPAEQVTHNVVSSGNYLDWYEENEVFTSMGAYSGLFAVTLRGAGDAAKVTQVMATPSLFATLGVNPALGRVFGGGGNTLADEDQVLISHALWQSRFNGDPGVIGKTVEIEETPARIAGVMPASFAFPGPDVQVWAPLSLDAADRQSRKGHQWKVVARLAPGVSAEQARSHMRNLADGIRERHPRHMDGWDVDVYGLHDDVVREIDSMLWLVFAVVAGTLLIACVNVANLMLARIVGRRHELSVRSALGAGRAGMARHVFAESGLYAVLGCVTGILLAWLGVQVIVTHGPSDIPRLDEARLSASVLAFSVVLMLGTTLLVGALPALSAARADPAAALSSGSGTGGGHRAGWHRALVVGQVALACTLAVCSGLLVHSFIRVLDVEPGYSIDGLVMTDINLPNARYPDTRSQLDFYRQSLERVRSLPEVASVAGTAEPPVVGYKMTFSFVVEGRRRTGPDESEQAQPLRAVTPGYFRTLEQPLLQGRHFTEHDNADAPKVVIVNRAFAELHWPDDGAIGKRISRQGHTGPWMEVVGVVGDTRHNGLDRQSLPAFYIPYAQKDWDWMTWMFHVIRTRPGQTVSVEALRAAIADIDEGIVVNRVRELDAIYAESNARRRFAVILLSGFGVLALALSMVGINGVLAYTVAQRQREFGIRLAVGSDPSRILGGVLAGGLKLTAAGLVIGLALALLVARGLSSQLFGISAFDPLTFGAVPAVIVLAAVVASVLPARRAAHTSPAKILRDE